MIKLCFTDYILFNTLIAFYLLLYVPCVQLVINLMKILFVFECFKIQVYTCKCFTASRLGVSDVPKLTFKSRVCFGGCIAKGGDCKVVIYNYFVLALIPCQI